MKNYHIYFSFALLAFSLLSCDENEVMPSFVKKGSATATMASLTVSTAKPTPGQTLTLTLAFVNPSSDPLTQITLKQKTGAADYADVETFSMQSEEKDKELTKTVTFAAPATKGTTVVFDMVINSQREYPQIKRTTVTVQ